MLSCRKLLDIDESRVIDKKHKDEYKAPVYYTQMLELLINFVV